MRYRLSTLALTGTIVLLSASCSVSRKATDKSVEFRVESLESVDSSRVESLVVLDSIVETKTITITKNEAGDTVFTSVVTDRTRARETSDVRSKTVDVRMRVDTVYIVKDSADVLTTLNSPTTLNSKPSTLNYLKWIFAIVCAIIVLIILIKIGLRRSLF